MGGLVPSTSEVPVFGNTSVSPYGLTSSLGVHKYPRLDLSAWEQVCQRDNARACDKRKSAQQIEHTAAPFVRSLSYHQLRRKRHVAVARPGTRVWNSRHLSLADIKTRSIGRTG